MSRSERDPQTDLEEFASRPTEGVDRPPWNPNPGHDTDIGSTTRCNNCGERVLESTARVFGDNDDELHGCPNCKLYEVLEKGGGANAPE